VETAVMDRSINKQDIVAGIIPVVNFTEVSQVTPYLELLLEVGLPTLEITLRNDRSVMALKSALHFRNAHQLTPSQLSIGVGTISTVEQLRLCANLEVDYMLSPGLDAALLEEAARLNVSYIPGVATASEIMLGRRLGCKHFKLFPASLLGGVSAVKALGAPFPDIQFCPTGGIRADNCRDYLSLPNVFAVGGSWLASDALLLNQDWEAIRQLMKEAVAAIEYERQ